MQRACIAVAPKIVKITVERLRYCRQIYRHTKHFKSSLALVQMEIYMRIIFFLLSYNMVSICYRDLILCIPNRRLGLSFFPSSLYSPVPVMQPIDHAMLCVKV